MATWSLVQTLDNASASWADYDNVDNIFFMQDYMGAGPDTRSTMGLQDGRRRNKLDQ